LNIVTNISGNSISADDTLTTDEISTDVVAVFTGISDVGDFTTTDFDTIVA